MKRIKRPVARARLHWLGLFYAFVRIVIAFSVSFFIAPHALASDAGQIIREARCKTLIRGPLDASVGDVLTATRRPQGQGAVVGEVRIVRITDTRLFGAVVGAQGDCRKFFQAYVSKAGAPTARSNRTSSRGKKAGPPPLTKMSVAVGPALSNTTLKGVARESVLEDYPLVLTALNIEAELYPFAFTSGNKSPLQSIGVEGLYRRVSSSSDVEVTTPANLSGGENKLAVAVKRSELRAGAALRIPLWAGRLFGDLRSGYYSTAFTSVVNKFEAPAGSTETPLELSPLRDLRLSGVYVLGGAQFQPVNSFRTRMNGGMLLSPKYIIDNRIKDAAKSSSPIDAKVTNPSALFFEMNLAYIFKSLQVGLDLSLETFRGAAFFPDGSTEGSIAESHFLYGFNVGYLL
ncbi:MAG: hypothetical protein FJY29_05810 [Betaproteobacteria bacterium]|nr:hypothetical protein [Betaproteobacteria bacterium]